MLLTEVVPGKLWWGSLPTNPGLILGLGIDEVFDLADPDATDGPLIVESCGYHKSDFLDDDDLDQERFLELAQLVVSFLQRGSKVLVHCTFGKNRSGLLLALVLRELEGISGEEALERVRLLRRNAVNNPVYSEWLSEQTAP